MVGSVGGGVVGRVRGGAVGSVRGGVVGSVRGGVVGSARGGVVGDSRRLSTCGGVVIQQGGVVSCSGRARGREAGSRCLNIALNLSSLLCPRVRVILLTVTGFTPTVYIHTRSRWAYILPC